ncbi:pilus assembly protein [Rhizobium laguerreae]|nr:pilus assembly protein [Rhizobium laguerreae]
MKKLLVKFRTAKSQLGRLLQNRDGVAGIEMAIVTPMLLLLLCGGGEAAVFLRSHFQASQMASTVADAISRYETITASDISSIFSVSSEVMGSSDFEDKGYVILSSVTRSSGGIPVVAWQCKGGGVASASRIGLVTKTATLPQNLVLDATDNVIVAEVFYQYDPIFKGIAPASMEQQLYKTAVFRPRLGNLTTAPGC